MLAWIKNNTGVNSPYRKVIGILLMILACCSFCYAAVVIKILKGMNTSQLLLYRSTFSFICNLSQLRNERVFFKEEHLSRIAYIRLIFGGVVDFCMIGAYQYLKLSEAASIMLTYPVIKCIFAKIFLEENMKRPLMLPFISILVGLLLIIKPHQIMDHFIPPTDSSVSLTKEERDVIRHQTFGYFLAIIFSLSLSTMDIIIHNMRRRVSQAVLVQYGYFGSIITSGLMIVWREYNTVHITLENMLLLFSAGLCYFLGQRLFGRALLLGRSSKIIPLTYLQILIQIFVDIFVFEQNLSTMSILGSILITLGNIKTILN